MTAQLIPMVPAESKARLLRREQSSVPELWDLMDQVKDPEIPALSIWDMGILQNVETSGLSEQSKKSKKSQSDEVIVTITPTYSGCPAMDIIKEDIEAALENGGYSRSKVVTQLSPAWTTDWMTPEAQKRMRQSGIAAPDDVAGGCVGRNVNELNIQCPQCGSEDTRVVSEFGSTACKALLQCRSCGEPFDYFKRI